MNRFIGTNVLLMTPFYRSSNTYYLTNLEIYSQIPETKRYEHICYIFIFNYIVFNLINRLLAISLHIEKSSVCKR